MCGVDPVLVWFFEIGGWIACLVVKSWRNFDKDLFAERCEPKRTEAKKNTTSKCLKTLLDVAPKLQTAFYENQTVLVRDLTMHDPLIYDSL